MGHIQFEVDDEISALEELLNKVPTSTALDDRNKEAINAQLKVLREYMILGEIEEEFEDDHYVLGMALDAMQWLWDIGDPPSDMWKELLILNEELEAVAV